MHIKNLSMRQIRKLSELELAPGILNTEALMLVLNRKSFSDRVVRVFKYLDAQEDFDVMAKKIYTVTTLNTNTNPYREIDDLVIPDSIIYVDGNIAGFAMPLIENHRNLGAILNDKSISFKDKLSYLYKLGSVIDKVQRVENSKNKFQFGDLNEFNFIIDQDDRVRAIDLDSAYLGVGEPLDTAYYLLKNQYILSIPKKYKTTDDGIVIPSDNTDLYCYNMIILSMLSNENLYRIDINIYYQYLEYLKSLSIPDELLESFDSIYIPKDNINPKEALKEIDPELEEKLDFKVFKKSYMNDILYVVY